MENKYINRFQREAEGGNGPHFMGKQAQSKKSIGYETETGALISEHDYQFLSDNQKARCKPWYPPTIDLSNIFEQSQPNPAVELMKGYYDKEREKYKEQFYALGISLGVKINDMQRFMWLAKKANGVPTNDRTVEDMEQENQQLQQAQPKEKYIECESCEGSGNEYVNDGSVYDCPKCDGSGKVAAQPKEQPSVEGLAVDFAEYLRRNNMSPNGFGGWGGGMLNTNLHGSKTNELFQLYKKTNSGYKAAMVEMHQAASQPISAEDWKEEVREFVLRNPNGIPQWEAQLDFIGERFIQPLQKEIAELKEARDFYIERSRYYYNRIIQMKDAEPSTQQNRSGEQVAMRWVKLQDKRPVCGDFPYRTPIGLLGDGTIVYSYGEVVFHADGRIDVKGPATGLVESIEWLSESPAQPTGVQEDNQIEKP